LAFLGLLVLALGSLGVISLWWFQRDESQGLDEFLQAEAQGVSSRLEGMHEGLLLAGNRRTKDIDEALRAELKNFLAQRLNRPIPYKTTLLILDAKGTVLAQSNQALDLRGPLPVLAPGETKIEDIRGHGPSYRVLTSSVTLEGSSPVRFRVACLLASLDVPMARFLTGLVVVLGGSLILLSILGAGLILLTLRPVRSMTLAAGQISEQNLDSRIPVPPGNDDLTKLAATLNGLLARLEADYAFQERLVGELTHQLKTPLTILRGRNEVALTTLKRVGEFRELVEDNLSDIDSLVNLLNTLLELARLDSRIDRPSTVPVDLDFVVARVAEDLEPLWLSKDLQFRREGKPVMIQADPEGLRQILTNLYDNAWKYAPAGATVMTRWEPTPGGNGLLLTVANQGPHIPESDLEPIFRRFYRSGKPAGDSPRGAGLGLSIVRSLVNLHGGTIRARNTEDGVAFEIRWPYESSR
jgi:signal transduction histidine kinase